MTTAEKYRNYRKNLESKIVTSIKTSLRIWDIKPYVEWEKNILHSSINH